MWHVHTCEQKQSTLRLHRHLRDKKNKQKKSKFKILQSDNVSKRYISRFELFAKNY
jgi:hypothetical protein